MWIGIDDTDSTKGGCTTYVARTLIKELSKDYTIIGYPNLVRLNPNIPWKTRGNGAVSITVAKKGNHVLKIGKIDGKDIFSTLKLKEDIEKSEFKNVKRITTNIVEKHAKLDEKDTNPGVVCLEKRPSISFYQKAVKHIVSIDETKSLLEGLNAEFKGFKNSRGLIGATAAISWVPIKDRTYEFISYRQPERWGKKRIVDEESVKKMDSTFENTFDNFDYENKHNRITPNSPCPILFGIRGDNVEELIQASSMINSEPFDNWLLFETNQGTDEHLVKKEIKDIQSYESVITCGSIEKNPYTIEGGHVFFSIKSNNNIIDCAAYEPTKQFRNVIRKLETGDIVEVSGGVRDKPLTINLEKIEIKNLTKLYEKIENPVCPKCKKHMKSIGKNQGFRCKLCGEKEDRPKIIEKKRQIGVGLYEVPICARRHLSKPLKRINKK